MIKQCPKHFSVVYMKIVDEHDLIPMPNYDSDVFRSIKVPSCPMLNQNVHTYKLNQSQSGLKMMAVRMESAFCALHEILIQCTHHWLYSHISLTLNMNYIINKSIARKFLFCVIC